MARHITCLSALALLMLGGCASNTPEEPQPTFQQIPEVAYEPPSGNPGRAARFNIVGSVPDVVGQVVEALNGPRFGITHVDRNRGIITATFRADPDDYLECGSLTTISSQGAQQVLPVASRRLRYEVPLENKTKIGTLQRDLSLDGRLIVRVRPSAANMSEVTVEGDYVLSREASLFGNAGQRLGENQRLVAFGSGQSVRFGEGDTLCQSNGLLEQRTLAFSDPGSGPGSQPGIAFGAEPDNQVGEVTGTLGTLSQAAPSVEAPPAPTSAQGDARGIILNTPEGGPRAEMVRREIAKLPCAPATVVEDPDGRVRVSGLIGSQADLDQLKSTIRSLDPEDKVDFQLVVTSPAACEVLTAALPLQQRNGGTLGGASIGIAGNSVTLSEGDQVVFDVAAPNFKSHLYIMYVQQDGGLVHLLPNRFDPDRLYEANDRFSIGDDPARPSFTVSPPYGDDLLILVASSTPLFDAPRPQIEDSGGFAAEFSELIAAVEAAGGNIVADLVFLNTGPKSS